MAMRQPIKSAASALRGKAAAKVHVGDGLEAILQNNPQLRRLVLQAKDRGSVTFDQLNAALPQDFPPEQTEEVIQLLDAQGIMVLRDDPGAEIEGDAAEAEPAAEGEQAAAEGAEGEEAPQGPEEELGRTDDPVRMYLREMGTIELLSREGEIEIAKRIEAGRNTVLEALCESPLTMRAVIGWRDAIREGRVLLRDIIDLDATNDAGPPAEVAAVANGANGVTEVVAVSAVISDAVATVAAEIVVAEAGAASAAPEPVAADADDEADDEADGEAPLPAEDEEAEAGPTIPELLEEDDFDEDTLSLSALENKLRDGVLETFDGIAEAYRGLRELQEERLALIQVRREVPVQLNRDYQAARSGMVALMQQISLNQSRVEALVQQLFDVNKHLQSLEGKLLRLATSARVTRESFLANYMGHELDHDWIDRVARLKDRGWADLVSRHYDPSGGVKRLATKPLSTVRA